MDSDCFQAYDLDLHRYTIRRTATESTGHPPPSGAAMRWTYVIESPEKLKGTVVTPRSDAPFIFDGPDELMLVDAREEDQFVEWAARQPSR